MNVEKFNECYVKMMEYWPLSYCLILDKERYPNHALSAFMYQRLGERVDQQDFLTGLDNLLATGGPHDPSNIIAAVNEVVNSRARKAAKQEAEKVCEHCLNTGMVSAVDRDNNGYAFRCPDKCKPLSEKIPLWETKYLGEGFRLVVVGGRLAINSI